MGFWFCNFQEFEKKKDRRNRLILNFYYVPSEDSSEEVRKLKAHVKTNVKIPTGFIFEEEKVEEVIEKLGKYENLLKLELDENVVGKYKVLEIEMPKDKRLIGLLPNKKAYEFQTGDYDKLLRLGGFHPERKVRISDKLEKRLRENEAVQERYLGAIERLKKKNKRKRGQERREIREKAIGSLEKRLFEDMINLNEIKPYFEIDTPTTEELERMSWLNIDIEKPLWKKEHEKNWLNRREKWLKKRGKYDEKGKERIDSIVERLEERLVIKVKGVGKVKLWENKYDADISFITSRWKGEGKKDIKELYVLDPKEEFEKKQVNDYKVLIFKTEKELVGKFIDSLDKRKPVLCSGHNEVYDITQIRFAADSYKRDFTPAVPGIKPRRDFVRMFFQRLKEDLIYLDTMWLSAIHDPFLRQRSLGTSLKLEDVAKYDGIDFKKIMSHEDLRVAELQRLYGKSKEIREKGRDLMSEYAASDVDPVVKKFEIRQEFLSLTNKIKMIAPYLTLTEIAFATNCTNKCHDHWHFQEAGNNQYWGRAQKNRENEIQVFKKRFASLKKRMLQHVGISTSPVVGKHENVYEIYLPFEEWTKSAIYNRCYQWKWLEKEVNDKERFGFLQYLKALEKDMWVDYYFARREAKTLIDYKVDDLKFRGLDKNLKKIIGEKELDSYFGYFKYLKRNFRSIYVALLKNRGIGLLRKSKKNLKGLEYPEYMEKDADLFLVRKNADEIMEKISQKQKPALKAFLTSLDTFEQKTKYLAGKIKSVLEVKNKEKLLFNYQDSNETLIFLYNQYRRKQRRENMVYAKWKIGVRELTNLIRDSYVRLKHELGEYNGEVVDIKGDYLFVKANENIKQSDYFYVVRELPVYTVEKRESKKKSKEKSDEKAKGAGKQEQLVLFDKLL